MKLLDEYSFNFLKDLTTGTITPSALSKVYVSIDCLQPVMSRFHFSLYNTVRQSGAIETFQFIFLIKECNMHGHKITCYLG